MTVERVTSCCGKLLLQCNFATAMLILNLGYRALLMRTPCSVIRRAAGFSTNLPGHWGRRPGCDFRADGSGEGCFLSDEYKSRRNLVRHATPNSAIMRRPLPGFDNRNWFLGTPVGTPCGAQTPWVARRAVGKLAEWRGLLGYATGADATNSFPAWLIRQKRRPVASLQCRDGALYSLSTVSTDDVVFGIIGSGVGTCSTMRQVKMNAARSSNFK
jgi:hypothetical protein